MWGTLSALAQTNELRRSGLLGEIAAVCLQKKVSRGGVLCTAETSVAAKISSRACFDLAVDFLNRLVVKQSSYSSMDVGLGGCQLLSGVISPCMKDSCRCNLALGHVAICFPLFHRTIYFVRYAFLIKAAFAGMFTVQSRSTRIATWGYNLLVLRRRSWRSFLADSLYVMCVRMAVVLLPRVSYPRTSEQIHTPKRTAAHPWYMLR